MGLYDREYDRRVRVEFLHGPLDGLVVHLTEDAAVSEPVIRGAVDGEKFDGAYVVFRRLLDGRWVGRYTPNPQENAA